jgi:hypothetical protein
MDILIEYFNRDFDQKLVLIFPCSIERLIKCLLKANSTLGTSWGISCPLLNAHLTPIVSTFFLS